MLKTVSSIVNALGALNYKGTWNADTNTPTLASGVGNQGDYYVVSVAGTTDLDGTTNWGIGDWAVFNGSIWERLEGGADGNFVNLSVSNEATFPDNAKAIFGTGRDLEIYHDGSHSYIKDTATGNLRIDGTDIQIRSDAGANMAAFVTGAEVQLYHNNQKKFETTATGVDISGTATMDGLTVVGNATISSVTPRLNLMESDTTDLNSALLVSGGNFSIRTQSDANALTAVRLNIDNATGDISFREDTGTTPKFYWDASAESLGIGNTDPSAYGAFRVTQTSADSGGGIAVETGTVSARLYVDGSGIRHLTAGTTDVINWDASGNVGIGTSIPGQKLEIKESSAGAGDAIIRLRGDGNNANNTPLGSLEWFNTDSSGPQPGVVAAVEAQSANSNGHMGKLLFKTHDGSGSEADPPTTRMTIDQAGNVLVGKTSTGVATAGIELNGANDLLRIARDGGVLQELNRIDGDGDIIEFRRINSPCGTMGVVNSNNLRIGGVVADHAGLQFGTNILIPETAGTASDGLVDIGTGANRYQDVYATNGTIQTSDGNEKQDIEALSDAEQRVAVAAKGLLRKFRWKSAVEAKGDEARTHFGIIAQDLQAAFAAEGLDAGDYGMFINSTWTDEETGEERSRMGVRYSELLAFIISAI